MTVDATNLVAFCFVTEIVFDLGFVAASQIDAAIAGPGDNEIPRAV